MLIFPEAQAANGITHTERREGATGRKEKEEEEEVGASRKSRRQSGGRATRRARAWRLSVQAGQPAAPPIPTRQSGNKSLISLMIRSKYGHKNVDLERKPIRRRPRAPRRRPKRGTSQGWGPSSEEHKGTSPTLRLFSKRGDGVRARAKHCRQDGGGPGPPPSPWPRVPSRDQGSPWGTRVSCGLQGPQTAPRDLPGGAMPLKGSRSAGMARELQAEEARHIPQKSCDEFRTQHRSRRRR